MAVFPSKSAMLMEHTLSINGDQVWHDSSDGIIISTPIGSSAYSMSAGGPVIFQSSNVFGIVSVNSLDTTRRPLIVSDNSIIEIVIGMYCFKTLSAAAKRYCAVNAKPKPRIKFAKQKIMK